MKVGWRFFGYKDFIYYNVDTNSKQIAISSLIRNKFNGILPHNVQITVELL